MLFETQDESEWREYLRRLRSGTEQADWARTRIETLCGRLVQPTSYRLSLFVPGPERADRGVPETRAAAGPGVDRLPPG